MKLTKRETILLYALAFVVLNLVAFSFLISPLYQQYLTVKLEADAMELEVQAKLNTAKLIGSLQLSEKGLVERVGEASDQQLTVYYTDELDEYLYYAISPYIDDWNSVTITSYLPFDGFEGSTLSYTQRAEVKIAMTATEEMMMQVTREFQKSDKLVGIRDININKGEKEGNVSFVVDFYSIRFDEAGK